VWTRSKVPCGRQVQKVPLASSEGRSGLAASGERPEAVPRVSRALPGLLTGVQGPRLPRAAEEVPRDSRTVATAQHVGADKKTRGRSKGERFTGGWNGSSCGGGAGIEMIVRNGITGGLGESSAGGLISTSTEGLGEACTVSSINGRWNCADS